MAFPVLPAIGVGLSALGLGAKLFDDSDEEAEREARRLAAEGRDARVDDEIARAYMRQGQGLFGGAAPFGTGRIDAERFARDEAMRRKQEEAQFKAIREQNDVSAMDFLPLASSAASFIDAATTESVDDKIAKKMAKQGLMRGYLPFDDGEEDTGWLTRSGRKYPGT